MSGKFEPKVPVQLNPPKDDLISLEELAKANGKTSLINLAIEVLFHIFHSQPMTDVPLSPQVPMVESAMLPSRVSSTT